MIDDKYNPQKYNPLNGLPAQYIHETFHVIKPEEGPWTVNRNNLFAVLRWRERQMRQMKWRKDKSEVEFTRLTSLHVWKILIPYRPDLTRFQSMTMIGSQDSSTQRDVCSSYEWIINSLHCWFKKSIFNRIEYCQWSISALIDILQCDQDSIAPEDDGFQLGAKLAQFGIATKVIEDILTNAKKEDLFVLQRHFENY